MSRKTCTLGRVGSGNCYCRKPVQRWNVGKVLGGIKPPILKAKAVKKSWRLNTNFSREVGPLLKNWVTPIAAFFISFSSSVGRAHHCRKACKTCRWWGRWFKSILNDYFFGTSYKWIIIFGSFGMSVKSPTLHYIFSTFEWQDIRLEKRDVGW